MPEMEARYVDNSIDRAVFFDLGPKRRLSLTLTVHQVAETRSKIDCPINNPDAILQIMFS